MKQNEFYINWKRVLLIVLLFCLIAVIIYASTFYRYINQSKTEGFPEAEAFVLENSDITEITNIAYFQAEEGYFTLQGQDNQEKQFYAFLKDNKKLSKKQLYIVPFSDVLSVNELEADLSEQCANCTLIQSTPAMIDKQPLWELTYTDDANRYVIEYKYLENGKTFEKLRLTQNYTKD